MARNTGRMALYEAMCKSRKKQAGAGSRPPVVRLRPGFLRKRKKDPERLRPEESRSRYVLRPAGAGAVQRIRLSRTTALLIAGGLVVVILVGIQVGRLGTRSGNPASTLVRQVPNPQGASDSEPVGQGQGGSRVGSDAAGQPQESTTATGGNVIVIATYGQERDLKPVQEFYAARGVATDIVLQGDRYFVVTRRRYDNPHRPGTEGYQALQDVRQIGAEYKAPRGYETFGIRPFQDAYGMKVR